MRISKRGYAVVLGTVATVLTAIVLYDIFDDWQQQGEALFITVAENSLPLVLALSLFMATYWLYTTRERLYLATVARWTVFGMAGILLILSWVIGIQTFQQKFKPVVIISHTAIGGAIAGAAIGYTSARVRQTRQELATEKRRWESLFDNDPAGIADLHFENGAPILQRTNDSFEAFFGVKAAEAADENLFERIEHEGETVETEIRESVGDGDVFATEVTSMTDAGRKYFKLRTVPYGIGQGEKRAFAIYTDVTDLRETQEELRGNVEKLQRSNERLQQFAYITSHDLQEPMRMVSSYMRLLEGEYRDELDAEAREYIDFAVDGAERMQDMVDGLLEYSRVRTRGEEFTEVDTEAVFSDTLHDLELRIDEAGATVTHESLPTVSADRNQLGQVFQNLVENAIDHGDDEPEIQVGGEDRDGMVVFAVTDDGPGIPESQQGKIFELFEHGGDEQSGTGIGLAICERIVARHDGDIWVESGESEGTTFYFTLPQ